MQENTDIVPQEIPNYLELTSKNTYHLKLPIKGQPSPLKLKIDYLSLETGLSLSKKTLLQLKGLISIYVGRYHQTPKALEVGEHTSKKTYE